MFEVERDIDFDFSDIVDVQPASNLEEPVTEHEPPLKRPRLSSGPADLETNAPSEIAAPPLPEVEVMADGSRAESASSTTWKWIDGKLCRILQTTTTVLPPEHMTLHEQRRRDRAPVLPSPKVEERADGSRMEMTSSITWSWIGGKLGKIFQTQTTVWPPDHMRQREQLRRFAEWQRQSLPQHGMITGEEF